MCGVIILARVCVVLIAAYLLSHYQSVMVYNAADCGRRNVRSVASMRLTSSQLPEEDPLAQSSAIPGNL